MNMRLMMRAVLVTGTIIHSSACYAQTSIAPDIERLRQDQLDAMRSNGMPDPAVIRQNTKNLMALPLDQQSDDNLQALAHDANAYANLVGKLSDKYILERRENYQYSFITSKLDPISDQYTKIGNEFKTIRDISYMHLAEKSEKKGDKLQAYLLYNDVYRLETFGCEDKSSTPTNCLRFAAELAMQRLLNIEGIKPYIHW